MIDIGLSKKDRKLIADALMCMLADTYVLLAKTQGHSWNVKGEGAYGLQLMLCDQSAEYLAAINSMAYRIRSLDYYVPSSFKEYLHLAGLSENKAHIQETHDIVKSLVLDNEFLSRRSYDVYDVANTVNDPVTRHLMQERMRIHSENAWKMRMHLE
jgi:starvation-inducible DNA-binding protein